MRIQIDLDAIKARVAAATAGPWRLETDSCDCGDMYGCSHGSFPYALRLPTHTVGWDDKPCDPADSLDAYRHKASEISALTMADAEFLAAAREDVPALIVEIERLREQLSSRARNEARLVNAFESLIHDTDGDDVDNDAEIPVGEIRRALHEATTTTRPYVCSIPGHHGCDRWNCRWAPDQPPTGDTAPKPDKLVHFIADNSATTSCCGKTPQELPYADHWLTGDPWQVTCQAWPATAPKPDDDHQTCVGCGDRVHTLSSQGFCDGCVEDGTSAAAPNSRSDR